MKNCVRISLPTHNFPRKKSRENKINVFTPRADSVESNLEGGAMYIESSPNADGYVPNSSLFGPWIDSPTQVKKFVPRDFS